MGVEDQIAVDAVDIVEVDGDIDHEERERRQSRAYTVEVRTPAGFEAQFRSILMSGWRHSRGTRSGISFTAAS